MKHKLTSQELYNFCNQLSILIRSGISPLESLIILRDESTSSTDKNILSNLIDSFNENGSLSISCEESGFFPSSMIAFLDAGEKTGSLDEILANLASHYEQDTEITAQIKSAVTYPLIMLGMMVVIIITLLVKVLPVFEEVFLQMGMEMNEFSRDLLNIGSSLSKYSVFFIALVIILTVGLLAICFNEKSRHALDSLICRIPIIKMIPVMLDYSRITQVLSLCTKSGFDPETSLLLAKKLISDSSVTSRIDEALNLLADGEIFSHAITQSGLFSGIDGRLISVAFQSGNADDALSELSQKYHNDCIARISDIISIIEPTIVIILSVLVGLILLSVMLPLLGILSEVTM